ncbi:hypothetical protein LCGC14_1947860, partial [marine sediment metagenome]
MGGPLVRMPAPRPQRGLLDRAQGAANLRDLAQRQQIGQAQLQGLEQRNQAQEQQQQEQRRMQDLFRETGGDYEEFFKKAPGRGIGVESLLKMKESYRKDAAEYRAQNVEERAARKQRAELYGNESAAILAVPENQRKASFMQRLQAMVEQGSLTPEQAQQFAQLSQLPDEEFSQQLDLLRLSSVGATKLFDAEEARLATERGRTADLAKPTGRMKEFGAEYETYLEATGKPRNAKVEREFRKEFNESRRTVVEKPPSRTSGASVKRATNRAIQAANENYQKIIRELDEFVSSDTLGEPREHRDQVSFISEKD